MLVLMAWIFGILGGLCAIMGIITAAGILPVLAGFTAVFWMALAGVLLLVNVAIAVSCQY
ncbi:MAG: hypothetical protein QF535_23200 [Anaerolineales bacterium]|nr:hypothetical protein [Anaerolineales bacterium]